MSQEYYCSAAWAGRADGSRHTRATRRQSEPGGGAAGGVKSAVRFLDAKSV